MSSIIDAWLGCKYTSDYTKKLGKYSLLPSLVYKDMNFILPNIRNVIWKVKRHIDAFLNVRGAVSRILKEVQKYTITKERSWRWISKEYPMTYELGSSIKIPKYFNHNIS